MRIFFITMKFLSIFILHISSFSKGLSSPVPGAKIFPPKIFLKATFQKTNFIPGFYQHSEFSRKNFLSCTQTQTKNRLKIFYHVHKCRQKIASYRPGPVTGHGMDRKCSYTIIFKHSKIVTLYRAVKQGAPGVSWEGALGRLAGCHKG